MAPRSTPAVKAVPSPPAKETEVPARRGRGARPKEDTVALAKHLIKGREHAGVRHTIDAGELLGLSFTELEEVHAALHGQGLEHWREG